MTVLSGCGDTLLTSSRGGLPLERNKKSEQPGHQRRHDGGEMEGEEEEVAEEAMGLFLEHERGLGLPGYWEGGGSTSSSSLSPSIVYITSDRVMSLDSVSVFVFSSTRGDGPSRTSVSHATMVRDRLASSEAADHTTEGLEVGGMVDGDWGPASTSAEGSCDERGWGSDKALFADPHFNGTTEEEQPLTHTAIPNTASATSLSASVSVNSSVRSTPRGNYRDDRTSVMHRDTHVNAQYPILCPKSPLSTLHAQAAEGRKCSPGVLQVSPLLLHVHTCAVAGLGSSGSFGQQPPLHFPASHNTDPPSDDVSAATPDPQHDASCSSEGDSILLFPFIPFENYRFVRRAYADCRDRLAGMREAASASLAPPPPSPLTSPVLEPPTPPDKRDALLTVLTVPPPPPPPLMQMLMSIPPPEPPPTTSRPFSGPLPVAGGQAPSFSTPCSSPSSSYLGGGSAQTNAPGQHRAPHTPSSTTALFTREGEYTWRIGISRYRVVATRIKMKNGTSASQTPSPALPYEGCCAGVPATTGVPLGAGGIVGREEKAASLPEDIARETVSWVPLQLHNLQARTFFHHCFTAAPELSVLPSASSVVSSHMESGGAGRQRFKASLASPRARGLGSTQGRGDCSHVPCKEAEEKGYDSDDSSTSLSSNGLSQEDEEEEDVGRDHTIAHHCQYEITSAVITHVRNAHYGHPYHPAHVAGGVPCYHDNEFYYSSADTAPKLGTNRDDNGEHIRAAATSSSATRHRCVDEDNGDGTENTDVCSGSSASSSLSRNTSYRTNELHDRGTNAGNRSSSTQRGRKKPAATKISASTPALATNPFTFLTLLVLGDSGGGCVWVRPNRADSVRLPPRGDPPTVRQRAPP